MILEERPDSAGSGEDSARLQGCEQLQSLRSHPQSRRACVHQLINKELRIRTGAENLYRATNNSRVRETVALELSYVNASLQLLKEELDQLDCGVDTPWPEGEHSGSSEGASIPMIPLGLKETQEVDWSTPLKELISEHFGEDGASYEEELKALEDLRQATRTPSRDQAGLELLMSYYNQLCFVDARFCVPTRSLGLLFHWYDSLTGVPAQQRTLAFEKGSVLFNIGALYTQIGARQDRSCPQGTDCAIEAFQRAAGAFSLLNENFSHAPSPDMSPAALHVLKQLMAAQAQECIFDSLSLPAPVDPHDSLAQLHLAQEAAQVATEYSLVHQALAQPPARDCVPGSWAALVQAKAEYFRALAHFHTAVALCDSPGECPACAGAAPSKDELKCELRPPWASEPPGLELPLELEERRKQGKAHLRRAILGQEEALRLHAGCRVPRQVDLLQAVVAQALRRSLAKYSELDLEDDFFETTEAPDIQPKTCQKLEIRTPSFSQVKTADLFHRLGPLSVFSAKNRWQLVGPVHVTRGEGGFGFTLRGDSPVLITAVIPGGQAAEAGLKEGDYIVSVNGQPCKWWKHAEVVAQLRSAGAEGVELGVVTLLPAAVTPSSGDRRPALLSMGALLKSQKGRETPAPPRTSPRPLLGWSRKAKVGKARRLVPSDTATLVPDPCGPPSPRSVPADQVNTGGTGLELLVSSLSQAHLSSAMCAQSARKPSESPCRERGKGQALNELGSRLGRSKDQAQRRGVDSPGLRCCSPWPPGGRHFQLKWSTKGKEPETILLLQAQASSCTGGLEWTGLPCLPGVSAFRWRKAPGVCSLPAKEGAPGTPTQSGIVCPGGTHHPGAFSFQPLRAEGEERMR
ncbi:PREDICTED: rhophilin-1 [Elephantulus edwardii]|uniref:rhophilin-1 n=1 Tax=Elephantulus edwardii TaxID=28737 RepID=UPI0003F0DA91|nr:PREDICTED: rhophilin-1 [Elephantulus edwardii]